MNDIFKEIEKYKKLGIDLFYNDRGNESAYKLFIRHIGYAPTLGYGRIKNGVLLLEKDMYIVDFEEGVIDLFLSGISIPVVDLEKLI